MVSKQRGTAMVAFDVYEPRHVLILGGEIGTVRLTWTEYLKDWCGGLKGVHKARRKSKLISVHSVRFDRVERRWRVERDELQRDVLVIGPRVALLHSLRDETDRYLDDQLGDLFAQPWIAREAAHAAAALSVRMGCELERVAL